MYGEIQPTKEGKIEIFKITEHQPVSFFVRSESVLAFQAHYRDRTLFCTGDNCPWCTEGLRRQWRGFLAVIKAPKHPGLLEVSAESYDAWQALAQAEGLYGVIVSVARRAKNAPAIPKALQPNEHLSWPRVTELELLDQVCRLLGIPGRSQYRDDVAWAFAVSCYYRQQIDHKPVYRLMA